MIEELYLFYDCKKKQSQKFTTEFVLYCERKMLYGLERRIHEW